ncbi:Vitamin B12 dependent methionine synthase activation subunit [Anaerotignum lactatifermentans]|uniref:Vitamin B12 dependent methionine synthase activation subunit n=1 Tax=Anaerotignum lactatifermentans TaxID=160404 RepID=A0ABS2GC88_9FIRM|nr:Vitamin B12 dependent methionine synthase activation subunit [Anaerotignum lactatifermentans]MBM6829827.1 Vitamin B12 dependent methionine synthase activation subunit [Anaerotignum lactatifermentans]MBM6878233.1 Vitamin B12 dependent methionine synthase activation subunit [Anaerotignum lactatifermentans]MBM6951313.1 Vitamin B12 dependent methionine synthase activation subunit [Anaerotignum lactatifermentans]
MVIQKKIYLPPPVQEREIFRYAGCREIKEEFRQQMEECLAETKGKFQYQVCWAEYPVHIDGDKLDLTFARVKSHALAKNLAGCEKILLFLATIGLGIDRLITRYSRVSPVKALWFQAIGAERIESLCDLFCEERDRELLPKGQQLRPRFSPGYGDLPLALQKEIFCVFEREKTGVFLNESLLMTPSKSVTAIAGIGTKKEIQKEEKCGSCQKADCPFKR